MALSPKLQAILDAGTKHEAAKADAETASSALTDASRADSTAKNAVIESAKEFDDAVAAFKS